MTPEKVGDGQIFLSRRGSLTSRDLLPGSDDKRAGSGLEKPARFKQHPTPEATSGRFFHTGAG